jgi:hypothetical protein
MIVLAFKSEVYIYKVPFAAKEVIANRRYLTVYIHTLVQNGSEAPRRYT